MVDGESPGRNVMEIGDIENESLAYIRMRIAAAIVRLARLLAEPAVS